MSYNPIPNPLPVTVTELAPATATLGTPINALSYATMRAQVDSLSGGDTITFARSITTGGTTYPVVAQDDSGNLYPSGITASGIYSVSARAWVTITHTGSASTPTITIMANQ